MLLAAFSFFPADEVGCGVEKTYIEVAPPVERGQGAEPTGEDIHFGYQIFARHYLENVFSTSRPKKGEIVSEVDLAVAGDEYEPLTLSLFPLRSAANLSVSVSELKKEDGNVLPPKSLSVGVVKEIGVPFGPKSSKMFRKEPRIIVPLENVHLAKEETVRLWLTIHVSREVKPGIYRGDVKLRAEEDSFILERVVPLSVEVLPFCLENIPSREFCMLFTNCVWKWGDDEALKERYERNARMINADMAAHGMTAFSPHGVDYPLERKENGDPALPTFEADVRLALEAGLRGPLIYYMEKLINTARSDLEGNWKGFDEKRDIENLSDIVNHVDSLAGRENWPAVYFIPIDEPGDFPDSRPIRTSMAILALRTIAEAEGKGGTTVSEMVDAKHRAVNAEKWEQMRPYTSLRIYSNPHFRDRSHLAGEYRDTKERGQLFWLYDNRAILGSDPCFTRMYWGIWGWLVNADGLSAWTYPLLNGLDGLDLREDKRNAVAAYQQPGWKIPYTTIQWECVREGIDDAKYINMLQRLLDERPSDDPSRVHADSFLERLRKEMNPEGAAGYDPRWSSKDFKGFRNEILGLISSLSAKWNDEHH